MKKLISLLLVSAMLLMYVPQAFAAAPESIVIPAKSGDITTDSYHWDAVNSILTLLADRYQSITLPSKANTTISVAQGHTAVLSDLQFEDAVSKVGLTICGGGTLKLENFFSHPTGGFLLVDDGTTLEAAQGISVCTSGGEDGKIYVFGTLKVTAEFGAAVSTHRMEMYGGSHVDVSAPFGIKLYASPQDTKCLFLAPDAEFVFRCTHSPLSVLIPMEPDSPDLTPDDISKFISPYDKYTPPEGYTMGILRSGSQSILGLMSSHPGDRNLLLAENLYIHRFLSGSGASVHAGTSPFPDLSFRVRLDSMILSDPQAFSLSVTVNDTPLEPADYTLIPDPNAPEQDEAALTLKGSYLAGLTPSETPFALKIQYCPDDTQTQPMGAISADFSLVPHTWSTQWAHDETHHWQTCTGCSAVNASAPHTWDEGSVTTAPTCTEAGVRTFTCTVCGLTRTEEIPAAGHTWSTQWAHDEAHHWQTCTGCSAVNASAPHTWDEGSVTTAPTCTEAGVRTFTCTVCGLTRTEEIPAAGHSWNTEWEYDEHHHWHTCTACENAQISSNHLWDGGSVTTAPTCTEAGVRTFTCTVCGFTRTEEIPAAGHTWSTQWAHDEAHHFHICTTCGTVRDLAEHTWDAGKITTAPTCTGKGEKVLTCTVCGASRTLELPALGHSWNAEWGFDAHSHWHTCTACDITGNIAPHTFSAWVTEQEPTRLAPGLRARTCSGCGFRETVPLPMLPGYTVTQGDGSSFQKGSGQALTFRADGAFSQFAGLLVDDREVPSQSYECWAGSTVVRLSTEYLESLAAGTHTLTFRYPDGSCSADFAVLNAPSPVTPVTADTFPAALLLFGFLLSGAAGALLALRRKSAR